MQEANLDKQPNDSNGFPSDIVSATEKYKYDGINITCTTIYNQPTPI